MVVTHAINRLLPALVICGILAATTCLVIPTRSHAHATNFQGKIESALFEVDTPSHFDKHAKKHKTKHTSHTKYSQKKFQKKLDRMLHSSSFFDAASCEGSEEKYAASITADFADIQVTVPTIDIVRFSKMRTLHSGQSPPRLSFTDKIHLLI